MQGILNAVLILGGMGLVFGIVLAVASRIFAVETDERLKPMTEALAGSNCGGCGYSGCTAYAQAVIDGKAPIGLCSAGGAEAAQKMSEIMGVAAADFEKHVAFVRCSGDQALNKGHYDGLQDCLAATKVAGRGPLACKYGCLGYGSCVKACKFDAIHIVNNRALVDPDRCTGCLACAKVCPRNVITSVPYGVDVVTPCNSKAKGLTVTKSCNTGCIACGKCEEICAYGAIHVENNVATIDHTKCSSCGMCAEVCPRKLITEPTLQKIV